MTAPGVPATWIASDWLGKVMIDPSGQRIGRLQDVYVDVETDEPKFGTVKAGLFARHLTFVPLAGVAIGPDALHVTVTKELVRSGPDLDLSGDEISQRDESRLYDHFDMNYAPIQNERGRRLVRR